MYIGSRVEGCSKRGHSPDLQDTWRLQNDHRRVEMFRRALNFELRNTF